MLGLSHNKLVIIVLMLCIQTSTLFAQQSLPELKNTINYYKSLQGFSQKTTVTFFTDENSSQPAKKMYGSVEMGSGLNHAIFDGRETMLGTDFVLMVDHPNKTVYYAPRDKKAEKNASNGMEVLDSVFIARYNVVEKKMDDTYIQYRLTPKKAGTEFKYLIFKINKVKHTLDEIIYVYAGEVKFKKAVIKYHDFNPNWRAEKNYFTISKFLKGSKKTAYLQPSYSTYKLINSFNYDPKESLDGF